MKKKCLVAVIALSLVVVTVYFLIPSPIVDNYKSAEIYRVELITSTLDYTDITEQVDCNEILRTLTGYSRSKIRHPFSPHVLVEGEIELSIMDKGHGKSYHIYLSGNNQHLNLLYENASSGGYTIHNSNKLLKEIALLLPVE